MYHNANIKKTLGVVSERKDDLIMIYTLNARGNVMLPVLKQTFRLTDQQSYREINKIFTDMNTVLKSKGIVYENLKSALIPVHKDHYEIAFIFDSSKIESSWYGYKIFSALIPALNKESTYSILVGDIIADSLDQAIIRQLLLTNLKKCHETVYMHSTQYFVVYINNLTKNQIDVILTALTNEEYFIGYVDMTFGSFLKTILAHCLVPHVIKHRNIILQPHEVDRPDDENINISSYPYEDSGFIINSINEDYFGLLLSYKIESLYTDDEDLSFSLNAIFPSYQPALVLPLLIPEAKLVYLMTEKKDIFLSLGLIDYTADKLRQLIVNRMSQSYLYNLEYLEEYGVPKFNVSLELNTLSGSTRKVIVSLKYIAESNQLQLVTMY